MSLTQEIIFDSETLDIRCFVPFNDLKISTITDQHTQFNNVKNAIDIKYDINESQADISEKILGSETKFLNKLLTLKKFNSDACWITTLGGKKIFHDFKKTEILKSGKDFEYKQKMGNSLHLSYNDKIQIEFNNNLIDIEEFRKICDHKMINLDLKLMLYAFISVSQNNNVNINMKAKVKEIKVLELKDKISYLFKMDNINTKNNYEYFQKYPTGKKKAVNNIMQVLISHDSK
jgi:hypothetical protein